MKVAQPLSISPTEGFETLNAHCSTGVMFNKTAHFHNFPYNVYWAKIRLIWKEKDYRDVLKTGQEAGLTIHETLAIFGYTTEDYQFINAIAWGSEEGDASVSVMWADNISDKADLVCSVSSAEAWPYITMIGTALDKLPSVQPQVLWRGDWRKDDFYFEIGYVTMRTGFTSTSHSADATLEYLADGGCLWAIENHTSGKAISSFSAQEQEDEVLFPMGSRFEIVECSPTTISDALRQTIEDINKELHENGADNSIDIICMKESTLPVCVDDSNWFDDAGNSCGDIGDLEAGWCRNYGHDDFGSGKADDSCCACGGGIVNDALLAPKLTHVVTV